MPRVRVMAVARQGFSGFYRAGRFWPSGTFTEADVDAKQLEQLRAEHGRMLVVEELDEPDERRGSKPRKPD